MDNLTYEIAVKRINEIKNFIKQYVDDPASLPSDFNYFETLEELAYLRNRIRQLKPKKL